MTAPKRTAPHDDRYLEALRQLWARSAYDRGFISNPFAGDELAALGLKRTAALLADLGNPQRRLRLLHVAGSKGKGSTCAFASSILTGGGNRTGRYTSPHLHSFRERFVIDDVPVTEAQFAELWDRALSAALRVEHSQPSLGQATAFEITTAMAFDYFAAEGCDTAVIEVGLGGTLDATNVISPQSTVISALDYEHTRVLGATLAEIAANKAGIIKRGVPVATAAMAPEAEAVIAANVREKEAPWLLAGRDWRPEGTWQTFNLDGPWGSFANLSTGLVGNHQMDNASLAVAGVWAMRREQLTESTVRAGLAQTRWPGRFEIVHRGDATIVLDGAHTQASAGALARAFSSVFPNQPATIVLGLLNDKDPVKIASELHPVTGHLVAVTPPSPRGLPASELAESLRRAGADVLIGSSLDELFASDASRIVLVTGSLTTVAWARETLGLAIADPPITI